MACRSRTAASAVGADRCELRLDRAPRAHFHADPAGSTRLGGAVATEEILLAQLSHLRRLRFPQRGDVMPRWTGHAAVRLAFCGGFAPSRAVH
mmetsp:Transcript_44560/g.123446  ORF Transcript_44560/g.123446 Transcript_44560/m.123446 type:complete len:93 (+) Transcript_44560:1135-1413(+)